ncbi:MAG: PAS domain-containing sensor histidine kinase [Alphaproteobacteria bacterium]|nr:PAS domain-containing sensor histidine kinase [Alphaproteobacteria bacterium]
MEDIVTQILPHLNEVLRFLPGSIYVKDLKGVYLGCNEFQAKMAGFNDPRDVIGKTDYDLPWKGNAARIRETDERIMKQKEPEEIMEIAILHDGTQLTLLSIKAPLYDQDKNVIGIVGTSLDITERQKAEERVREMLKMQAGAIAHEMRTPLASLSGIGLFLKKIIPSLVKDHNKLTSDQRQDHFSEKRLSQIIKSPEMIVKVTRQAFSFIDIMLMSLREDFRDAANEDCSIKKCIEEALTEYPFGGDDRSIVKTQFDRDFEFKGNSLLIKHVFFNLLKNSVYYVKAANKGDIIIKTTIVKGVNTLSFKDTGTGIASDILPHIFDKFYSRTKYGTGIGLAFCKSVMTSLGGDIICTSLYGVYTEFILTFPPLEKS